MLLSHNKKPYEELTNILSEKNCACLVMGTGVGKSYITLEYLINNNLKALIVSPRTSINDSWKKLCGDKVDTITYQKLANIYNNIDYSFYDLVICDEVHHIGAPKWGAPIKYLIDNNIIKVFGLTESPIRYTDGARDIGEEFFGGNIVLGETVPSAIEKGILNPVTYVGAMYNSDGLKKTIRGKVQSRLYAKLNLAINKTPTVKEIIKKNMPSGKRKGIIFASTIDDINFAIDFVHSIYPNIEIRSVHSKKSDAFNEKNMEWFKNTNEGYICSVDMISEGIHIKGVNTLIMLRRTESVNLFNQQLGRCLDASSKEPAILFDLVNNKYTIKVIKNKLKIKTNSIFDIGKINVIPSKQLIINDYTKDIVDVLKEIKIALEGKWTEQEIQLLKDFYMKNPSGNGLNDFVKNNISNHSLFGARWKARDLELTTNNNFTEEEIEFIKENYLLKGPEYVAQKLGRTREMIINKAHNLHISTKKTKWTKEELDIVKKYYPIEGIKVLKRLPKGITVNSLINFANKNKIYYSQGKKVKCVETNIIYNSIREAALAVCGSKKSAPMIWKACNGKKKTAYGYHWRYVNE